MSDLLDEQPARIFCVVAPERADVLLAPLREHFADEPLVAVLVERRTSDSDPRQVDQLTQARPRAPVAERDPVRALPPELQVEAPHLRLVQRMEPLRRTHEDTAMAELVGKSLAAEPEAVSELWWRVSERVLARVRLRLGEVAAQNEASRVLGCLLDELPGYEPGREPLSSWLDTVVDRYADAELRETTDRIGQRQAAFALGARPQSSARMRGVRQ
jgi:hypothetical protein